MQQNLSSGFQTKQHSNESPSETSQNIEISSVASFDMIRSQKLLQKALFSLCGYAGWSVPLMFTNPEDRFSGVETHMVPNVDFIGFVSDEKSSF